MNRRDSADVYVVFGILWREEQNVIEVKGSSGPKPYYSIEQIWGGASFPFIIRFLVETDGPFE